MASTTYLTRFIYKTHTDNETDFAGSYNLMVAAKSAPSPVSPPNNVESTTFEDDAQTFEKGIKQSSTKEVTGNLDKQKLSALDALGDTKLDIMQLYGTDGVGGVAKYAYVGTVTPTPSDASGIDSILEMTVSIIPNTAPQLVTDEYTVVDNGDDTFTVTKSGGTGT